MKRLAAAFDVFLVLCNLAPLALVGCLILLWYWLRRAT